MSTTPNTQTRTAGPWYYRPDGVTGPCVEAQSESGYNMKIAECGGSFAMDDAAMTANANFIVEACNAHDGLVARIAQLDAAQDALVAALKQLLREHACLSMRPNGDIVDRWPDAARAARIALAKCGDKQSADILEINARAALSGTLCTEWCNHE